ncbi:efflux transporter outer membrane subunit [Undibacterium terreum]|nr:efflux transporter outer membrane subunit [Undibacterium terreum]
MFNLKPCIQLLACAFFLSACTTAQLKPQSMDLAVPEQWSKATGESRLDQQWWNNFGDPVLAQLIDQGLRNNKDLRIAAARVAEARALRDFEAGEELPSLGFGAGGERARALNPFGKPYSANNAQAQFQAAYEVDVWGRLSALTKASEASLAASKANQDAVALSVAANIAATYINLRTLDARLIVARQTLVSRTSALKLAQSRRDNGDTSFLELSQSKSEYHATAQVIPQLETAIHQAEHRLAILLGQAPGPIARGKALDEIAYPELPGTGLPSELLKRRPDIAAAEDAVVASNERLSAAKAQLLPSVKLSASLGRVTSTALSGDPFTLWSLGGSILAPVFEGGRLTAQVNASVSRADQALITYEKTVLTAFGEVEDELAAIDRLAVQISEAQQQTEALTQAVRIAHSRYQAGYVSYLDEVDAQRNLFNVQQALLQLQAARLVASVNLYRALGGGWQQ